MVFTDFAIRLVGVVQNEGPESRCGHQNLHLRDNLLKFNSNDPIKGDKGINFLSEIVAETNKYLKRSKRLVIILNVMV